MVLNPFGLIVQEEWTKTEKIRPTVSIDSFVIMPNHLHGIIIINDYVDGRGALNHPVIDGRGTLQRAPTMQRMPNGQPPNHNPPMTERFGQPTSNSIPTIVRLFKSATTKRINILRGMPGRTLWQRNYYEHIIRNESELDRIREYIYANPSRWAEDQDNPDVIIKNKMEKLGNGL